MSTLPEDAQRFTEACRALGQAVAEDVQRTITKTRSIGPSTSFANSEPRHCIREAYYEYTYAPFEIVGQVVVWLPGPDVLAREWTYWYADGDVETVAIREPVQ